MYIFIYIYTYKHLCMNIYLYTHINMYIYMDRRSSATKLGKGAPSNCSVNVQGCEAKPRLGKSLAPRKQLAHS